MDKEHKYIVSFKDEYGLWLIDKVNNFDEFWSVASKFIEEEGLKSSYQKYWVSNGVLNVDIGSHTKFFQISRIDMKDMSMDEFLNLKTN